MRYHSIGGLGIFTFSGQISCKRLTFYNLDGCHQIWSPSQPASEDWDAPMGHLPSRATFPLYSLSNHMQGPTSQMKRLRNNATQTHNQPVRTYNGRHGSLRYQPDEQRRFQGLEDNTVAMGQGGRKNCCCSCHTATQRASSHVTVFNEDQQRPGVIMVPVSREKEAGSVMKHMPLQVGFGHCVPI